MQLRVIVSGIKHRARLRFRVFVIEHRLTRVSPRERETHRLREHGRDRALSRVRMREERVDVALDSETVQGTENHVARNGRRRRRRRSAQNRFSTRGNDGRRRATYFDDGVDHH